MSKGNAIRQVRIPPDLWELMVETIERRNRTQAAEPWTTSEFIRAAIREKIAKMERGRSKKRKGTAGRDLDELQADEEPLRVEPETMEEERANVRGAIVTIEQFLEAWEQLASEGSADELFSMAYVRVLGWWIRRGKTPISIEELRVAANAIKD